MLAAVRFQKLLKCRPLPGWPSAAARGAPPAPCTGYHGDSGQERRLPPGDQALLSRGPGCAPGPCHRAVAARPPRGDPAARFRPSRRDRTERGGLSLTQPRFPRRTRPAEPGARGGGDVRLQGLRVHFRAALAVPSWPDGGRTARAPRHLSRGESSDPAGSRLLNYTCQKLPTAPRAGCVVWGRTTPARGLGACWGPAASGAARAFNPAVPRPAEFPQAGQSRRADQGAAVSPGHRQGGRRPALPSRGTRDAPSAAPRTSRRSSPGPSSRRLLCCSRRKRKVMSTGFWVLRHTEMVLFLHLSAAKPERSAVCKHRKRKSHFETLRTLEKTWPALVSELVSPQNQARPPGPPCLEERRARAGQRGPAPCSRGCETQS